MCVCVCRESWYVGGCNYFQLGVHYEYIAETPSFGFINLGASVFLRSLEHAIYIFFFSLDEMSYTGTERTRQPKKRLGKE